MSGIYCLSLRSAYRFESISGTYSPLIRSAYRFKSMRGASQRTVCATYRFKSIRGASQRTVCAAYRFKSISGNDATWHYLFIYLSHLLYAHIHGLYYRETIRDSKKTRRQERAQRIEGKIAKGNGRGVGKWIG